MLNTSQFSTIAPAQKITSDPIADMTKHLSKNKKLFNALNAVSETKFPGGNNDGYWYVSYLF